MIGLAGRYPGAENVWEFWNQLREGKNCVTEIPGDRWNWRDYFDAEKGKEGAIYTKWGGFIKDIDQFDPLFFHIAPKEAENMDPQERLFLETAYSSIEDAGYTPATLCDSRKIGVFVGVMNGNYPTGSNFWSIANRISYLFNFQGPSLAVDTACSSSLTALHLALESLDSGASECAITGGVNLILTPVHWQRLSALTMLAADDRCKSFGDGADGIVDSEGVGAIVLKPLSKAVAAGDHIYGIIKGSMLNAGGKTNGYTVPNPSAQYQLIAGVLKRAGANARTISYLEAHGTGTALGDPIEIAGLNRAFSEDTRDKQFCAIGSVKSNIGHCESAAGIAGVTKVLLQLKYRQLVPSLHSERLNSEIDFPNTPFVVQQTLAEWKRPVVTIDGVTKEYPRIAGISSFGAGGANAHVVIEEYIPKKTEPRVAKMGLEQAIIVLSARNEDRLKERVWQLLAAIKEQQFTADNSANSYLADLAYTLQVGREAMEERLGIIAVSLPELAGKLQDFTDDRDGVAGLYRGQVKRHQEALAILAADEEMGETVGKWIGHQKYGKLLDLWVKGLVVDWNQLYGEMKPGRISLPAYPFAKERYWFQERNLFQESYWLPESYRVSVNRPKSGASSSSSTEGSGCQPVLHPLVQQNTSDLSEQRFSSTFTGAEFFLADYWMKGQRVLPGVTCLEMAEIAVTSALGATTAGVLAESWTGIKFKNIVWALPGIAGEQPFRIHVGLLPVANNEIAFEIYHTTEINGAEPIVHCQGVAISLAITGIPALDLQAILDQCSQPILSAAEVYESFKAAGIDYGPGYRGIEAVYRGRGQILAKLCLPASVSAADFILHPSIMDSALQAAAVTLMSPDNLKPVVPAALRELQIYGKCSSSMWALIRFHEGSELGAKPYLHPKFDIDLCDETGTVRVRLEELEVRAEVSAPGEANSPPLLIANETETYELMTFEEVWREEALSDPGAVSSPKPKKLVCFLSNPQNQAVMVETFRTFEPQAEIIFISRAQAYRKQTQSLYHLSRTDGRTYTEAFRSIRQDAREGEVDAILYLWPLEDPDCIRDYSCIFYLLHAMGTTKLNPKRVLFAAEFKNGLDRCYLESWIGFERTLRLILPDTRVAAIYQAPGNEISETPMKDWALKLRTELRAEQIESALYQAGKRLTYRIKQVTLPPGNGLVKPGGTYLITGGCGGLGLLFAEHLARNSTATEPVNLILTGRSVIDTQRQLKIKALEATGCRVLYLQATAGDPVAMKEGLDRAKECFGGINGVIHAAGIAGGQTIFENEFDAFQKVLEPKINGTLVLDELLAGEPLDFIGYFSSTAAVLGDFGSCDYAVANRFLMAYAHYRNLQLSKKSAGAGLS